MGHFTRLALGVAVLAASFSVGAANTYITNPFGLAYKYTTGTSTYARPGGLLVTSACNRYDSAFASARANGAEILAYLNPVDSPDWSICDLSDDFFYNNPANVPLWPWPSYGKRINYRDNHLTDLRKGSAWSNHVVAYVEKLMREDKVDGVFLDVVGGRLWSSLANWDSWPQWEKDSWTDGSVDLVRRLDAKRRAINPRFIIINNGNWTRNGDTRAAAGEPFVDGVSIEHHAYSTSAFHREYAGRRFSNLGHRRVLVIGRDTADTQAWAGVQGVTHVANQTAYTQVASPVVSFHRLTDRPKRFGRATSSDIFTPGLAVNTKRGSKFNLAQKGMLLNMAAYLDGNGGPTGGQSLRMLIYRDSSGVPGSLVAQSSAVSVQGDMATRWVYFPAPAAKLDPGNYWIMIHSGSTSAIARIKGDGNANYRSGTDTYSDGGSNPAGSVTSGTMTLSLFASYTVGY